MIEIVIMGLLMVMSMYGNIWQL